MRHPRVWEQVREDGCNAEDARYDPAHVYFRHRSQGFMMFRRVKGDVFDCHIAMIRGGQGLPDFVAACLACMRSAGACRFIAPISDWNKPALRLAARMGFVEFASLQNCWRDGRPHHTIYLEAN